MKKPALQSVPSNASVWWNWYAGAAALSFACLFAIGLLTFSWANWERRVTREAAEARLADLAAISISEFDGAVLTESQQNQIEGRLSEAAGVASVRFQPSPERSLPTSSAVVVTVPAGDGYLVLAAEQADSATLPPFTLPGLIAAVIGCIACVFWHVRNIGTAGLRRIGSSLAALESGETDRGLLTIAERFGPAAIAWNRVIMDREDHPEQSMRADLDRRGTENSHATVSINTLDAVPYGLIGLDHSNRIVFCNGAAASMLREDRKTLLSKPIESVSILEPAGDSIASVTGGSRPRASLEMDIASDESQHTLRIGVRAMRKSDGTHVLILVEDVTQQRIADQARDSFVVRATHELRTPLTNIKLAAEEAIDSADSDPTMVSMSLNIVNQEARRLERVVSDMLNISEMQAASLSLRIDDVSIDRILDDLDREFTLQAEERSIALTIKRPGKLEKVLGDKEKIYLLLHNIVGNAIKYTPDGGAVSISATQQEEQWSVEVTDTGPGITEDEQPRIFEKFYRTSNAKDSDVTGSGLGLSLAYEIAQLHGGSISLDSTVGNGSTFVVQMPNSTGGTSSQTRLPNAA